MSQNDEWYLEGEKNPSLYFWIFQNMAMGAIYAAIVLFGLIAVILIIRAVSFLLPEDPFAALDAGQRLISAIV